MIRPVAVAVLLALLSPLAAVAGEKTVILNVDNATCALCAPSSKRPSLVSRCHSGPGKGSRRNVGCCRHGLFR